MKEHTFETLGLDSRLLSAVASDGYTTPTPIQTESIPHILAGRDILGIARTGTGKTAAFALPALQHLLEHPAAPKPKTTRVLVLAPTRELAAQIAESFASYGKHMQFALTTVFGGVNSKPQERTLARGVDVLCATPGRLLDLHQRGFLNLGGVEYFVLDEADRMFDMGFIHDIRRVVALLPPRRQTLFFSATMPPTIAKLADSMLNNPVKTAVPEGTPTAERVEQLVCFVSKDNKKDLLVHMLKEKNWWRVIVFTRTKHGANRLAKQLCMHDLPADAIHANKSQNNRQRTMAAFKSGDLAVLVATDLAARGIDVDDIELVVNYDLPNEEETYVHRIGRTARAGAGGMAVSFCDAQERSLLRDIERFTRTRIPVELDHPFHQEGAEADQEASKPKSPAGNRGPRGPRATLREDSRPERTRSPFSSRNDQARGARGPRPAAREESRKERFPNPFSSRPDQSRGPRGAQPAAREDGRPERERPPFGSRPVRGPSEPRRDGPARAPASGRPDSRPSRGPAQARGEQSSRAGSPRREEGARPNAARRPQNSGRGRGAPRS